MKLAAARVVALVAATLFCLHLSRFYLVIPGGCSHPTRDGYALQHCKDAPSGLAVNPVQLGGTSAAVSPPALEAASVRLSIPAAPAYDISLPPPFHPPRNLFS